MGSIRDHFEALLKGDAEPPPIAKLIGMRLVAFDRSGTSVFEMDADEKHWNPMGTLHGGVLCDLADAAMGHAFASTLGDGESFTTIELKINYLRPVWRAHLTAKARVVKRGSAVGLVECDVTDEKDRLIARSASTCMVLRGDAARGR